MNRFRWPLLGVLGALMVLSPAAFAQRPHRGAPCSPTRHARCGASLDVLAAANEGARNVPRLENFSQARQIYPYAAGALYEIDASPTYVSVILLEPGEAVSAIAAGDTSRWMVTEAEAEGDGEPRTVILVKPQSAELRTNIAIITDRRTYLVEARSAAGDRYSAEIAWTYPARSQVERAPAQALHFGYRIRTIRGARPVWLPSAVFDDGQRTWIAFPAEVAAADLPPLFVITPEGAELVNYRVEGRRYVVDRIFDRAELRLGVRAPIVVRIDHGEDPRPRRREGGRP